MEATHHIERSSSSKSLSGTRADELAERMAFALARAQETGATSADACERVRLTIAHLLRQRAPR
jgi:hypothetical protein